MAPKKSSGGPVKVPKPLQAVRDALTEKGISWEKDLDADTLYKNVDKKTREAAQSALRGHLLGWSDLAAVGGAVAWLPDAFRLPLRRVLFFNVQSWQPGGFDLVDLRLEAALGKVRLRVRRRLGGGLDYWVADHRTKRLVQEALRQ